MRFDSDTGLIFRREILRPFLDRYLKDGAPRADVAPVAAFEEYVSDPAKPVPFRARPIQPVGYDNGSTWSRWLVDDQREASGRPDVVALWRASRPWAAIRSWCRPTSSAAAIARAWRPPDP